jgi:hypothetical protein
VTVAAIAPPAAAAAAPAVKAPAGPTARFDAALEARLRPPSPPSPPPANPLAAAVRAIEAAQARLDGVLAAARCGRTFTAGQLLGLQAEAYRFTQTLDVAGKLVEQGVQGVKQAVNTQV